MALCPKCSKSVEGPEGKWCSLCATIFKAQWQQSRKKSLLEAEGKRNAAAQAAYHERLKHLFD
jgi:hypothetical protein